MRYWKYLQRKQYLTYQQIQEKLKSTKNLSKILSREVLDQILNKNHQFYVSTENKRNILNIYQKYLKACYGMLNERSQKQGQKFWKHLGQEQQKVWGDIFYENMNCLNMLQYIKQDQLKYFKKVSLGDIEIIVQIFRYFNQGPCQKEIDAFACLYKFLWLCCQREQNKEKQSVEQIKIRLKQLLQRLKKQFPGGSTIRQQAGIDLYKNWKKQYLQDEYPIIVFKSYDLSGKKNQLQQYIVQKTAQASLQLHKFHELISQPCLDKGRSLKVNLKVNKNSATYNRSINRCIQKLFEEQFQRKKKQKSNNSNANNLDSYYQQQKALFQKVYKQIISDKKQVKFIITDLLRAKCLFRSIEDINECIKSIQQKVQQKGYQILKIKNRFLNPSTSDIMLKIKINQTIAQLQLAIQYDYAQNQFHHKIYEIQRSPFYDSLNFLRIYNESFSLKFFNQLQKTIDQNNKLNSREEQIKKFSNLYTFHQGKQAWQRIKQALQIKTNQIQNIPLRSCIFKNDHPLFKINKNAYSYGEVRQNSYYQLVFINNLHLKQKTIQKLRNYQSTIQQEYAKILNVIGQNYFEIGNYAESMKNYLQFERVYPQNKKSTVKVKVLKNIAEIYSKQYKFKESIQYLQRSEQIQRQLHKQQTMQMSQIYRIKGQVFWYKGNYAESLQINRKCLAIIQKIKGKKSIQSTEIYNNMGLCYKKLKRYQQAQQYYGLCLQIERQVKGKVSKNIADVLTNIGTLYIEQYKYNKAIQKFKEALSIQEHVSGSDSINSAVILNNIGLTYKRLSDNCKQEQNQKKIEYYKQTINNLQKSLKIYKNFSKQNPIDVADLLSNIATVHISLKEYQAALQNLQEAQKIHKTHNSQALSNYSSVLQNFAYLYQLQNKHQQSIIKYLQAVQVIQKQQVINYARIIMIKLDICGKYFQIKKYKQGIDIQMEYVALLQKYTKQIVETEQRQQNMEQLQRKKGSINSMLIKSMILSRQFLNVSQFIQENTAQKLNRINLIQLNVKKILVKSQNGQTMQIGSRNNQQQMNQQNVQKFKNSLSHQQNSHQVFKKYIK